MLQELACGPEHAGGSAWDRAPEPGTVIGRFELVREVGRGGFGVVYEARDTELGRTVAFKAVCVERARDVREERLLREAEAAARCSHPNIVTLFDVGRSEHGPYLVLEFLRGQTLARRLAQGALSLGEGVRIGIEVAKGLAHAHAQGVVHRDLTPGNIFLCEDGLVKVLDLGMAHAFGRRKVDGGTPGYMAPEQWRGAPEDERTDVFALGVILYQMLANERPFPEERAPPARAAPALDVPGAPAVGELIGRMLEQDPVKRPRDASEVLAALTAFHQELERVPTAGKAASSRIRRHARLRLVALTTLGVVLGVAAALLATHRSRTPVAVPKAALTVAVLPFTDMSPAKDQEYLGDGIAEEVINALTRVEGLQVVGRSSSFSFKGRSDDLREVGRKLGAGAMLEGSVRQAGSKVRVTAQLVNAADGYDLWSETYDRELTDVLALEEDIARAVVNALRVRLARGSQVVPKSRRAIAPEVYTTYLIGRHLLHRNDHADFERSQRAFEKAIALDPGYAPAWAGLAQATFWASDSLQGAADVQRGFDRAVAAAERALTLDPELGQAYATRGLLRAALRWDWKGARNDFERALQLNPGDADVHRLYAQQVLRPLGRLPEAITEAQRATELDPLDAAAWHAYGTVCALEGQLEHARQALDRSLELQPDQAFASTRKAVLLLLLGRPAESFALGARITQPPYRLMVTAMAAHSLGRADEARRALDDLVAAYGDVAAYQVAYVFAWRRERDKAFEWLERAYRQHDSGLPLVKTDPVFRDLRGDPRFATLLRDMGLSAH